MSAVGGLPAVLSQAMNNMVHPSVSQPQSSHGKGTTEQPSGRSTDDLRGGMELAKPVSVLSDVSNSGSPTKAVCDQASTTSQQSPKNMKETVSVDSSDSNEHFSTSTSQSDSINGATVAQVNDISNETPSQASQCKQSFELGIIFSC